MENIAVTAAILIVCAVGTTLLGYLAGQHIARHEKPNTLNARMSRLGMLPLPLVALAHVFISYEQVVGTPIIYLAALAVAFAILGLGYVGHNMAIDNWNKANPDKPPK
ncbi:hypothetical protein KBC79_01785 [Candidatus Woesebacteria bacterium]|nr:hypothetical protein [Candidatus Woesebacteria bacterium]